MHVFHLEVKSTDIKCPDNELITTEIGAKKLYLPEPPKVREILFYILLATEIKILLYFE